MTQEQRIKVEFDGDMICEKCGDHPTELKIRNVGLYFEDKEIEPGSNCWHSKEHFISLPVPEVLNQQKYKRVDLDQFILTGQNDYCDGNNKVIGLIKSKYGDLYYQPANKE